jgi:fatty-acyl-CoA synthase
MGKPAVYRTTRLTESYWPADTSRPLLDWTPTRALREVAAEVPDRLALVAGVSDPAQRRRWTYAQLLVDVERLAPALLARFKPGERVAIWAPNVVEWVLLQLGCHMAGLWVVPVNPAFKGRELHHVLHQSGAAGLFLVDEYRGTDLRGTVNEVRARLPGLREVIRIGELDRFIAAHSAGARGFPDTKPNDPAFVMYTSGTTGVPKGAVLHNMACLNTAVFCTERAGLEHGGVYINPIPMFHIPSNVMAVMGCIMHRATHVLVAEFQPALVCDLIEKERGTYTLWVPTMLEAMLDDPARKRRDLSSLRHIMSGAAMVEARLVRRARSELGCSITVAYGQTEAVAAVSLTHMDDAESDQAETIGQPMPQCEVKIADISTGAVLPLGAEGEICVRGAYKTMLRFHECRRRPPRRSGPTAGSERAISGRWTSEAS